MPTFSRASQSKLDTCEGRLILLFETVVERYDCTILCGARSRMAQDEAFAAGKSKKQWPDSKHNVKEDELSLAVDVAPYPINWENLKRFYHFAGYVKGVADQLDITIRYGGDWDMDNDLDDQDFMDLVHFEVL